MSPSGRIRVLLAEDNRADAELNLRELKRAGVAVEHRIVNSEHEFAHALAEFAPDVIVSDFTMPKFDGMAALALAHERAPDTPFIFVSGTIGEEHAIRALKNGAIDYVLKGNLLRLPAAVERALHDAREKAEKRKVERALQESDAGLRRAQMVANLAHVITGPAGEFLSWSETLPLLAGLDPKAMPCSTRDWLKRIHPADRARFRATAIEAGKIGGRSEVEYRLQRGGETIQIRQVLEPLTGQAAADGKLRWFNTLQDVTELRRTEEEQRSVRQLLDNIVDNIPTSVQLKSVQDGFRIVMWNKAAETIYGLPREDAIGRNVHDLWPEPDADRFHAADLELVASRRMQDFPDRLAQTRDRGQIHVHMRKVALFDAGGKATHLLVIADDITESQRAERILALEHGVARQLAGADSAARGVQAVIRLVCESEGWNFGRYWRVDEAAGVLRFADAWSVPGADTAGVTQQSVGIVFAPGVGLAGKVWQSGQPLWVSDVGADPRVLRKDLARAGRLRGAFVFPVMAEGRTIGVLSFSSHEIRQPDERLLDAVQVIGGQIGQFLRRKQSEEALVASEEQLKLFVEHAPAAIAMLNNDMRYVAVSHRWLIDYRLAGQDIIGHSHYDVFPEIPERWKEIHGRCLAGAVEKCDEEAFPRADGTVDWVKWEIRPWRSKEGAIGGIMLFSELITERKEAADKIRRLSRVHAVLSGIDALIVRVRDRNELFREACRIAVEVGGLPLAWIGILDREVKQLKPVAWHGTGPDYDEYIGMMRLGIDDAVPEGRGMAGRAVRDRKPVIANDIANDPRITMKKDAEERGFRSLAILPLLVSDQIVGTMALYVGEVGFFDDEEMRLLQGLAGDISFALDHLEKNEQLQIEAAERLRAETRVARLNRVYAVLSGINSTIMRVENREELFKQACRIAVEAGKFLAAWIGIVDRSTNTIAPVAWQGLDDEYLQAMPVAQTVAPGSTVSEKMGLAPLVIMQRKPIVAADMTTDPRILLRKEAQDRGFRSLAMLPLVVSGEAVGVLALYAAETDFFDDEEEMKLLNELAGDIGFAIDHIEKASKLNYLAFYDQLTGLANRALFLEQVNQSIKTAGQGDAKFALAILDIERLRSVNESLGRQAGDALIKLVAERLKAGGAQAGIGRIGADHFALILGTVKGRSEAGRIVTNTLHKCFDEPFQVNGAELRLSAKAGVAQFPGDGDEAETLLRNAEAALRRGKHNGDRITFHAPEMTARIAENLTLETKLRQALEKEEFVLHYQPKVNLESRQIVGTEALIRWNSPERGLVPPGLFIPLLEETGLILQVGAWAMRRAVHDHGLWLRQGVAAPRIAVNVSAIQLRQRDFVEEVKKAIAQGADPAAIDLEITESLLMDDIAGNITKLKALRDLGMKLSIDDFGTGYSSLGYLAKLPVHTLKIDRSFITTMLNNPDTMTLVSTMISLAHSLRLTVVAEGVEQEEQAKMLRLLRCDEMQGYLFSKPLPFEELTALLRKEEEAAA